MTVSSVLNFHPRLVNHSIVTVCSCKFAAVGGLRSLSDDRGWQKGINVRVSAGMILAGVVGSVLRGFCSCSTGSMFTQVGGRRSFIYTQARSLAEEFRVKSNE